MDKRIKRDVSDASSSDSDSSSSDSDSSSSDSDDSSSESDDINTDNDDITTESNDITAESDDITTASDDITTESDGITTASDDITTASDDITTERSDDITTEIDSTTPVDECALFGDFIDSDLAEISMSDFNQFNYAFIAQTAQRFFDLLTSAPVLFANLSLAVGAASSQIMIPPCYLDESNREAVFALQDLYVDFVALANDSCGIALNDDQISEAVALFIIILPASVIFPQECDLLNVTIIEQAVAAADVDVFSNLLENEIRELVGIDLFLRSPLPSSRFILISRIPDDMVPAAAQALLDDFLFLINDFCGIPPLSNTTLTQLDEYFLVDLVAVATGNNLP